MLHSNILTAARLSVTGMVLVPLSVARMVLVPLSVAGMVLVPLSHSSRTIIAFWWLFTLVVVGTYNGNLIAFLTAPEVYTGINSIEDLYDRSEIGHLI